jgi:hypothetical protein
MVEYLGTNHTEPTFDVSYYPETLLALVEFYTIEIGHLSVFRRQCRSCLGVRFYLFHSPDLIECLRSSRD